MLFRLFILLAVGLECASATAQKKTFSGPQPGERITPFKVLKVTGPFDAKEFEIEKARIAIAIAEE